MLLVARFLGREGISEPFEFFVTMYSHNGSIAASDVLRKSVTVAIQISDSQTRHFNGIFRDFAQGGFDEQSGLFTYEGTIVPSLWLLSLTWNCKIFQNMTVPAIVSQVLNDSGVTEHRASLIGAYPPREYCVQYRESNLNFISRLLEEEGISYYFQHTDGAHKLVLVDSTSSAPQCIENQVCYSTTSEAGNVEASTVWSLSRTDQLYTPKVALTDYYFETPSLSLLTHAHAVGKSGGSEEKFDYPGKYTTLDHGNKYGNVRMDELETFATVVRGESSCSSFTSGLQFTLSDYYRHDANQAYLLTSLFHNASAPHYVASQGEEFSYVNRFEAIPSKVDFKPPRRAHKPIVSGSQTAVIVGPQGEEIYVDKYGRVKVQFFWDRVGQKDQNSSCWVRVSQIWAGKNWGWITIPRIGQEVVVDFLEGDPDRPLIVGRIYNADQMPPYDLPANSTQSGIKTRSSKGGGAANYNEIRFEDKMGDELLTVHAEKDMLEEVEHNRTITVGGTHTETVEGDTAITIKKGDHSLTLDKGTQTTKVSLGSENHEAMQQIELKVGQSTITLTQQGITIKALNISIEGTVHLEAKSAVTSVTASGPLTLKGAITTIN